jgi:hypothetical protein
MDGLDSSHHIFRHVGGSRIHDDFIDSAAFRRKNLPDGTLEPGLSVNWTEYFQKPTPQEAVPPLCEVLRSKGRTLGPTSRFALLNVGQAKKAASKYANVSIVRKKEQNDPSHAEIRDYDEAFNEFVAEELQKIILATIRQHPKPDQNAIIAFAIGVASG